MVPEKVGVIDAPDAGEIDARPTKRFFVRMLVRDIELIPAIVDLIDNSVDGAKRLAAKAASGKSRKSTASKRGASGKSPKVSNHRIDIKLDANSFVIEDNCGGIELDRAINYAFRFGRPDDIEPLEGEVGQFGVGMKRALFKLGEHFVVDSVAPQSRFTLDVDVPKWLAEDRWAFPLDAQAEGERNARRSLRTRIEVSSLLPSVAMEFSQPSFLERLRTQIEFSHQEAVAAGIEIRLNGQALTSRPPTLLSSGDVKPRVVSKRFSTDDHKVSMRLYSGFVKLADEDADTDDPDRFSGLAQAGWYVICNGRMLVFADKSRLTGWGDVIADYHPQYRRFRGYVYLTGDSGAMPWNTAKTAVDEDSPVWGEVRKEIVNALLEARTAMNKIKREVGRGGASGSPMTTKLEKAKATPLADLSPSKKLVLPSGTSSTAKKPKPTQRIDFEVPHTRFQEVAESFELSQPAAIGKRLFEYYYEREISD
jgi:hypothetical protein